MVEDSIKSIKAYLYERSTSPLSGAFVISWIAWNYRFFMTLFSEGPPLEKYRIIDQLIFPDWTSILTQGILYPAATAAIYLLLYPIPALKVFEYSKRHQVRMNQRRKELDGEELLTKAESLHIRRQINDVETNYLKTLEEKDAVINDLEKRLQIAILDKAENEEKLDEEWKNDELAENGIVRDNLSEDERSFWACIGFLSNNSDELSPSNIKKHHEELSRVAIEHFFDKNTENGLFMQVEDGRDPVYEFTAHGRASVIKHGLV